MLFVVVLLLRGFVVDGGGVDVFLLFRFLLLVCFVFL